MSFVVVERVLTLLQHNLPILTAKAKTQTAGPRFAGAETGTALLQLKRNTEKTVAQRDRQKQKSE